MGHRPLLKHTVCKATSGIQKKKKKKKSYFQILGLSVLQDQDPRGKDFCENGLNERTPLQEVMTDKLRECL